MRRYDGSAALIDEHGSGENVESFSWNGKKVNTSDSGVYWLRYQIFE